VYRSRPFAVPAFLVCLSMVLAGCHAGPIALHSPGSARPSKHAARGRTVPLDVRDGGSSGVIALVRVWIDGQGPLLFALDTGASSSLVDAAVAQQLGIRPTSAATRQVRGIAGEIKAQPIRVARWRVGSVRLPPSSILMAKISSGSGPVLAGLLGSDVLSEFQTVVIDYGHETLTLRGAP
jgi:predicted aspartyl protease